MPYEPWRIVTDWYIRVGKQRQSTSSLMASEKGWRTASRYVIESAYHRDVDELRKRYAEIGQNALNEQGELFDRISAYLDRNRNPSARDPRQTALASLGYYLSPD